MTKEKHMWISIANCNHFTNSLDFVMIISNCAPKLLEWLYFYSINPVVVERFLDRTEYFLDKYKVPWADDGPRSIPSRIMGMCELLNFGPSPPRAAAAAANAAFNDGPHTAPDVCRQIQTSKARLQHRNVRCLALTARGAWTKRLMARRLGGLAWPQLWSCS